MRSSQINRSLSQGQAKPKPYSPPKVYDKYIYENAFEKTDDIPKYILSFDVDSCKRFLELSRINKRFRQLLQHYPPPIKAILPKINELFENPPLPPLDLVDFKKGDWFKLAKPYLEMMKATSPEFQREVLMDVLRTIQKPPATTQTEEKKGEQVTSLQPLAVEVKTGLMSAYQSIGGIIELDIRTQRDYMPATIANHPYVYQMPLEIAGQTRAQQFLVKSFLVRDILDKTIVAAAYKRPGAAAAPSDVVINIAEEKSTAFEGESVEVQHYSKRQKQTLFGMLCFLALTGVGFAVCQTQKDSNAELSRAFGIIGGIMTLLSVCSARVVCHYHDKVQRNTFVSELAQRNRAASRAAAERLNVSTEQREQLQRPLLHNN